MLEDGKYYLLSSGKKKTKMRFREVIFLEAAEFQFWTRMTAVAAVVLRVIGTKPNRTRTEYYLARLTVRYP